VSAARHNAPHRGGYPGRVRIVGGRWRGRVIEVADEAALRPTGARVRETLFNWLAPVIEGARCLDLFAGSGVLGFEAASRGAASVCMIDRDPRRITQLREIAAKFGAGALVEIVHSDAAQWLGDPPRPFDIVFLDPPFRQQWVPRCLQALSQPGWLSAGAIIYVEIEVQADMPELPPGWQLHRDKQTGQVRYLLLKTNA
jgi:16S rRNA (guanine966-N2)-methyltransferase